MARKLGITSPLDEGVPAIGLGGLRVGVTPLEMAHAYATIANKGVRIGGCVLFHEEDAPIQDPSLDPISIERIKHPRRARRRQPPEGEARDVARPNALRRHRRDAAACSRVRHRRARVLRPPGRRQDRHHERLQGRLVRRLHAAAGRGRLGRLRRPGAWRWRRSSTATPSCGGTYPALAWKPLHEAVHTKLPVEDWPGPPSVYSVPVSSTAATARRAGARRLPLRAASSSLAPTRRRRRTRRARAA